MTLAAAERLDNAALLETADPSGMLRQRRVVEALGCRQGHPPAPSGSPAFGCAGRRASSTSSTGMSSRTG